MIAAVGTPERRTQDKEMLENPSDWPYWPVLPMKRPRDYNNPETPHLGFVTADYPNILLSHAPESLGILLQLIYESTDEDLAPLGIGRPTPEMALAYLEVVTRRYFDIDALLDDGWTVD